MSEYKFPVEATHITMFARSAGETNPIYYDEEYAKGTEPGAVIAPPTFAWACSQFDPDYPLRPRAAREPQGQGRRSAYQALPLHDILFD